MSDDLYEGFNDSYGRTNEILQDEDFLKAVRQTSQKRKQTSFAPGSNAGGMRMKTGLRLGTGFNKSNQPDQARLMTAVRAAGFSSSNNRNGQSVGASRSSGNFDGPAPPLETKPEETSEEKIKSMEKKVIILIEESCMAAAKKDLTMSLEKAREAGQKERVLVRQREQMGVADQINLDLTYSVLFNLANQYSSNGMYQEALNTFQAIVKNKMFVHAGRLKVNMGNIYFMQKNYAKAIKMYRMGLDQVLNTHKLMRIKIMQNIGIAFVKLNQYNEAISSFEQIMRLEPDVKTGFNLILCYYALHDRQKMKAAFQKLLQVDLQLDDEDRYLPHNDDKQYDLLLEIIKNDDLRKQEIEKKDTAENCIKMAAKIIAPVIEANFTQGYDWCINQVKSSLYHETAYNLEIDKAIMYLKQKDFNQQENGRSQHEMAIETLKSFEKKETRVASSAATNLSFIYYLEGNLQLANKYADQAIKVDRYNSSALVNKGNVQFQHKEYDRAKEFYQEAVQNDSSCIEALYNLGLTEKKLHRYEEALDYFFKLHAIMRNSATVIYQIADINSRLDDSVQATDMFMQLHGLVNSDPSLLQRLGDSYEEQGDKSQAFTYYYDSFKYYPSNLQVIEWLGAYYIESQFCEKAISYFERAALMQPSQVKWQLMIASCHRKSGNYQQALESYKSINRRFPDNIDCLQFLVRICGDMDLPEAAEYANRLKKAERQKEARDQRIVQAQARRSSMIGSAGSIKATGSRENSASASEGGTGSRENSAGGKGGGARHSKGSAAATGKMNINKLQEANDDPTLFSNPNQNEQLGNVTYSDPIGPAAERPKTAARSRQTQQDEFANEEIDDFLLPE